MPTMTQTTLESPEQLGTSSGATARAHRAAAPRPAAHRATPYLLQTVAMIGLGALLYAPAADWFATLHHNSEISGYVEQVEQLPAAERAAQLRAAESYNAHLPQGILRDPYTTTVDPAAETAAYRAYEQVLRVSDNGVIGSLSYPRLGIGLPIFHGTSESVLSSGVGHLYGSSLPTGGTSTHSVLTSHSGLVRASLFTPLTGAKIGDTFTVDVIGETHYYQVDQIETVLPEQTGSLRIVGGEDHVTLITCTPVGINSHRLLVRGTRVAAPEGAGSQAVAGDGRTAGFPWWAVGFLGGSALTAALIFAPPRRRGGAGSAQAQPTPHQPTPHQSPTEEAPA